MIMNMMKCIQQSQNREGESAGRRRCRLQHPPERFRTNGGQSETPGWKPDAARSTSCQGWNSQVKSFSANQRILTSSDESYNSDLNRIERYLELQMSSIDGDMAGVASTQTEEMDRLREEETSLTNQPGLYYIHL